MNPSQWNIRNHGAVIRYRHDGVVVSSTELTVRGRRYPLAELTDIGIVRLPRRSRTTTGGVTACCLLLQLTSCSWQFANAPVTVAMVLVTAAVATLSVFSLRFHRHRSELWATHRGDYVLLYWSDDARTFEQIRFALCRSLEHLAARPG